MNGSLTVIFPIFNEEEVIAKVISNCITFCRNNIDDFEVIAVNDGSVDSTRELLYEQQQAYPDLRIINHDRNKGYGCAIRSGIDCAQKEWTLVMDADAQFQIGDLEIFWMKRHDYDFMLGYRRLRQDNLYRKILGKTGNSLSNIFLQKKIKDINCGFKIFKTHLIQEMELKAKGGAIHFEIIYNILKKGQMQFTQIPIVHHMRRTGKSSGGRTGVVVNIILEGLAVICRRPFLH